MEVGWIIITPILMLIFRGFMLPNMVYIINLNFWSMPLWICFQFIFEISMLSLLGSPFKY